MPGYYGLTGLIALLLTIWALVALLQSNINSGEKLIWVLVVILLPVIGFLIWYLMGPGSKAPPWRRSL
jgi:hypothetical protein